MHSAMSAGKIATSVLVLISLAGPTAGHAQAGDQGKGATTPSQAAPVFDTELRSAIEKRIAAYSGAAGVALVDLQTEQVLSIRGEERFPSASIIKVPLMIEVFARVAEGQLALFDPLTVLASDHTAGTGVLQFLSTPKEITVGDATFLMITLSDNVAANLLLEKLRPRAVNERMKSLGLESTQIFLNVGGDPEDSFAPDSARRYGLGVTTPLDMATVLTLLYQGEVVSPEASGQMREILARQFYRDGLPRYLPEDIAVFNMTGSMGRARNECGIVDKPGSPFVLCVMTWANADARWTPENEGEQLIADLARIVFERIGEGSD